LAAAAALFAVLLSAQAVLADYAADALYENRWCIDSNGLDVSSWTNQAAWTNFVPHETSVYGGHVYSNPVGAYSLEYAAFGQPLETRQADFEFGDVILPPPGADLGVEPAILPAETAFYAGSAQKVYAADAGSVRVDWIMDDGSTNRRVYKISPIPTSVPSRIFWTEDPHDSPPVDLGGKYVTIHYNSQVAQGDVVLETNGQGVVTLTQGLWLDTQGGQKLLRALGCEGLVLVEFFETGFKQNHIGVEILEVLRPKINIQQVDIGSRLQPANLLYGDEGLLPSIVAGAGEHGNPRTIYQHSSAGGSSPKENWVFGIARTVGESWRMKIYWKHRGLLDVEWPYEVDQYEADWPDPIQLYVREHDPAQPGPAVLIPQDLTVGLQGIPRKVIYQEPDDHATVADDARSFSTDRAGYALLAYTAVDEVWFECVRSVYCDDTNFFDLDPVDWPVASEIVHDAEPLGSAWMEFPGYINTNHTGANGMLPYNASVYAYPTPDSPDSDSYIYGVNEGELEVWWANPSLDPEMRFPVRWPSEVVRYNSVWPTNAIVLPIAGNNNNADNYLPPQCANAIVYRQNDADLPGFNPNEEHALLLAGQVYPIRCDLNEPDSSDPYVLIQYQDGNNGNRPDMLPYRVVMTNAAYPDFTFELEAGTLIQAPMPLTVLPNATASEPDSGPAWRDRNLDYWARSAGNDGTSTVDIVMHFHYPVQSGFYFPWIDGEIPEGQEVAFLSFDPDPYASTPPVDVIYEIRWPDDAPTLHLAETLVKPKRGLPAIDGQKSAQIIYEQSYTNAGLHSVVLFDPIQARGVALGALPDDVEAELATDGKYYFPTLPPHLRERVFWDPSALTLNCRGAFVEPPLGEAYLLVNTLNDDNRAIVAALSEDSVWDTAVGNLGVGIVEIGRDDPHTGLALSAGLGQGVGYVTLAFNNSTNLNQPFDPISLSVIQVDTNLYQGEVKVIESANPLDEQLTLRHSGDFAGHPEEYEFEWRTLPPVDGMPPTQDPPSWNLFAKEEGKLYVTISGPGLFTLSDNYFLCRYRSTNTNCPVGTDVWSEWTASMLAEGWIKRALSGITPFEQRIQDLENNEVDTLVSMIAQAGARWEGDVPLNLDAVSEYGLIEIYETILRRGQMLSIDAGFNYGPANDALLLAAGRISDFYMLLGNEAYADAMDPTFSFGSEDLDTYSEMVSSMFSFMNQVPSVLDEEMALLRGRDDSFVPSVETVPVYNRLVWNFTDDIVGGEVAYVANYNISDQDNNGLIDEADAAVQFPQGHGDAWGHYLAAIKNYYRLLGNTNFTWVPRIEAVLVGGAPVSVDYYDERKFAGAAEAKARTGAAIVDRSYRAAYSGDDSGTGDFFEDSDTDRAWGVTEWGCRAGLGAYFDWVTANSLLPSVDSNVNHVGIQQIDRNTVAEIRGLPVSFQDIQETVDNADMGLNPLGLARDAVPFDISPSEIAAGKTHFEQIYERALQALNNAQTVLDHVQYTTQILRQQMDSQQQFGDTVENADRDYGNALIEIFGYPYSDDIGPGKTYADGYDGPDFYHFQYVDYEDITGQPLTPQASETLTIAELRDYTLSWNNYKDSSQNSLDHPTRSVDFHMSALGLMIKPEEWTGSRRACGRLQMAYGDFLLGWCEFRKAVADLNLQYALIDREWDLLQALVDSAAEDYTATVEFHKQKRRYSEAILALQQIQLAANLAVDWIDTTKEVANEAVPKVVGLSNDSFSLMRAATTMAGGTLEHVIASAAAGLDGVIGGLEAKQEWLEEDAEIESIESEYEDYYGLSTGEMNVEWMINEVVAKFAEVQSTLTALVQAQEQYLSVLAEGQRLVESRTIFRQGAATRIQKARYADMAFRIFRNDALRQYHSAFDLAAAYVYLAAKAYDYETALLEDDDATPGNEFMARVARTRSLGVILDGEPQVAGWFGDPGLADCMARMQANWTVLEGRLGFNNPETETSRFSLRTELFRVGSVPRSDATWRAALWMHRMDDLKSMPEYRRYCLPFDTSDDPEPGIVIPFPTTVQFGKNFFGRALAGGDNAYDASHFATKIRSVGVWFSDYDATGLANTPRVYLLPVGTDVMRTPGVEPVLRTWEVFDQALPVPFDLGGSELADTSWIALDDSLSAPFAERRRFGAFRAYHDAGSFDESETHSSTRLIGRSVWNTQWMLVIPAGTLHSDREQGLRWFIDGQDGTNGVSDIKLFFQTYSYAGN